MNRFRWLWMVLLGGALAAAAQAAPETVRDAAPAAACFEQGNVHARAREFDQAIASYSEALRHDPNFAGAWINRGNLHLCRQEFALAVADYDQAIRLKPLSALVFANRGLAHAGNHDGERAIVDHDEALRLAPDFAKVLDAGQLIFAGKAEADDAGFDLGAVRPLPSYGQAYYQRGNRHLQQAPDLAVADYTAALRFTPDAVPTLINRGVAHAGLRYYDRAHEDLSAALARDPNCAAAYYSRGVVALYQRDFDKAVADFTEAISLEPGHAAAYNARSLAWKGAGNADRAAADFRKALRLDLDDRLAMHGCAHGLLRTACECLALKCRARPRRTAELRNFEDAVPWYTLALDLPSEEAPPAEAVAAAEAKEPDASMAPDDAEVIPAVAWIPAPEPAPARLELPEAQPLATPAPPAAAPAAVAPAPPVPAASAPPTVVNVPAQPYDQAAAFWYSPAPIFFTVVIAALVLGASVLCVALLILLPQFHKSKPETVDVQQLISLLVRDQGPPPWQRRMAGLPPVPAAPTEPPAPVSKAANPEEELAQNILADNLKMRAAAGNIN